MAGALSGAEFRKRVSGSLAPSSFINDTWFVNPDPATQPNTLLSEQVPCSNPATGRAMATFEADVTGWYFTQGSGSCGLGASNVPAFLFRNNGFLPGNTTGTGFFFVAAPGTSLGLPPGSIDCPGTGGFVTLAGFAAAADSQAGSMSGGSSLHTHTALSAVPAAWTAPNNNALTYYTGPTSGAGACAGLGAIGDVDPTETFSLFMGEAVQALDRTRGNLWQNYSAKRLTNHVRCGFGKGALP